MSWASQSLKVPLSSWAPKPLPFTFLRYNPGGVWKDPDWVALSPELHLLTCLDDSRLWHIWETWNGQQMQNLALGKAWWKQGGAAHTGCDTDGGVWKELSGEEKTWSEMHSGWMTVGWDAFVKIRGKEVPTQGFGDADGLERACCRGSVCKARSQNWTQMPEIIRLPPNKHILTQLLFFPSKWKLLFNHELSISMVEICSKIAPL